jgi:hypothetical protein
MLRLLSRCQVPRGEENVLNPLDGQRYKIRWGTDETGILCVLECRLMTLQEVATCQLSAGQQDATIMLPQGIPTACPVEPASGYPACVDVTLPDGSVMYLPINQQFVLNPLSNQPFEVLWGTSSAGAPTVLSCTPCSAKVPHGLRGEVAAVAPANFFQIQQGV